MIDIILCFPAGFINFIVSPLFEVFSDVISHVLDKDPATSSHPWQQIMADNKEAWQEKVMMLTLVSRYTSHACSAGREWGDRVRHERCCQ